jgi:hypothetical protein
MSGKPHGTGRTAFDRWFRYPAGFNQDVLALSRDLLRLRRGELVCDPFAGVGSTGTFLTSSAIDFVGIEAHPLISELASLKFAESPDVQRLRSVARDIVGAPISSDISGEHLLIQRSFTPASLMGLVALREAVKTAPADVRPYLKWALLGSLRECASVRVGWPYQQPGVARKPRMVDPQRAFLRRIEWIAEDSEIPHSGSGRVVNGDSRTPLAWRRATSERTPDGILTSPPYLNNFDYADATRLELYFWGYAENWGEMVRRFRSKMMIATTQQTSVGRAKRASSSLRRLSPQTADEVDLLTQRLSEQRSARARGKEYDRVLPAYFADMARVFSQAVMSVRPGAPVLVVIGDSAPYGTYIDTPRLLTNLAVEVGFTAKKPIRLRARGERWVTNGSRHKVPLREDLVILAAPK